MEYTITLSSDRKFIVENIKGVISREIAMHVNLEAHALGKRLGITRYLIDVTEARNIDKNMDTYEFAYEDMRQAAGIDMFARVAILVSLGDHSHDFVETVLRNAGLNVRLFTNLDEATRYLVDDLTANPPASVDQ